MSMRSRCFLPVIHADCSIRSAARCAATTPRAAPHKPLSEEVRRCKRVHPIHPLHVRALGPTGVFLPLHSGDHYVDRYGGVVFDAWGAWRRLAFSPCHCTAPDPPMIRRAPIDRTPDRAPAVRHRPLPRTDGPHASDGPPAKTSGPGVWPAPAGCGTVVAVA